MFRAYRRLSIPTKLIIAVFAMFIPLGTLFFFVELGFQHDINVGTTEKAGTQCLREAYKIQHYLINHRNQEAIQHLSDESTRNFEIEQADPTLAIEQALTQLDKGLGTIKAESTPFTSNSISCVDLTRLRDTWKWYIGTGRDHSFAAVSTAANNLIRELSNCAQLAIDPALDSQMLSRVAVGILPRTTQILGDMQQTALELTMHSSQDEVVQLTPTQLKDFIGKREYFQAGLLRNLLEDSALALSEDGNYYTDSESLTMNYGTMLGHYQKSANLLLEVADRMESGQATPTELFNAASRTQASGLRLFNTAMDELDILISKRIESYQKWRLFATGMTAVGLLTAFIFFMTASRSISRGLTAVGQYSHEVAEGDYDAVIDDSDLGPRLTIMAENISSMVGTLKDKISYLDGVLRGFTSPCFVVDQDERITFVSDSALRLAEMEGHREHIIGRSLAEMVYGDPTQPTISGRAMALKSPITDEFVDFETPSGDRRHVRLDVTPLTNTEGEVIGAFAVANDLTTMLEKESHIERLAAFPREAPDPVMSADEEGTILYRNTAVSNLLEKLDHPSETRILPEGHVDIVERCLASNTSRQGIESDIGDHVYSWTYHPIPGQNIVHMYATDVTKRIQAETKLLHEALHDTLTGLPNKALFLDRVNQAFRRARTRDTRFSILFLDLDGFKNINDGLGHNVGDKLLARFAWRIRELLRADETVARLGGDEFTVLLPLVNDDKQGIQVAKQIQRNLIKPFEIDGRSLSVTASIGVINAPEGTHDATDLIRDAETAMYHAKSIGRGQIELFSSSMHKLVTERIQMENDLKTAVERGEFEPYYQPIISLESGRISGFEALIRWNHRSQGVILPNRFIPMAEETGLIVPIGSFMLETACKQAKQWQNRYIRHRDLNISVNMSVEQITRPATGDEVEGIIKHIGIPPHTVKIEVTESGLMNNVARASDLLTTLEQMGVSLMIDDFGTGYSSLSHLHQFPFHILKIDRSFITTMEDKPDNMEIVRSIISLAHSLGKQVVAEGVETESQLAIIKDLGCEFVQGFYFSKPLPTDKAETLLIEDPRW